MKFLKSIKKSTKPAVQFLFQKVKNNVNTVTGKIIAFVIMRLRVRLGPRRTKVSLRLPKFRIRAGSVKVCLIGGSLAHADWGQCPHIA